MNYLTLIRPMLAVLASFILVLPSAQVRAESAVSSSPFAQMSTTNTAMSTNTTNQKPLAGSAIVFINGIATTFDEAVASSVFLQNDLAQSYPNNNYVYGVAYNATEGIFSDLVQVFKDKAVEGSSPADFWLALDGGLASQIGNPSNNAAANQALEQKYIDILKSTDTMPEIATHLAQYRAYLAQNRKVVLVGHSQGTIYANFELNFLLTGPVPTKGTITSVNVADVCAYVLPGSSYVTSSTDTVIAALSLVANVVPSNITDNWWQWWDALPWNWGYVVGTLQGGHSFTNIYLNNVYPSHDLILQRVYQQG